MKITSLLLLPLLAGCRFMEAMYLPMREPLQETTRAARPGPMWEPSSFSEMARAVNNNAPDSRARVSRSGTVSFASGQYKEDFRFEYDWFSPERWSLNLYRGADLLEELQMREPVLLYQNIRKDVALRSHPEEVWKALGELSWRAYLRDFVGYLRYPNFDPSCDWVVEEDGVRHLIIARVLPGQGRPLKEQIYLHKKRRVVARIVRNTAEEYIVEDIHFDAFREVSGSLMPQRIVAEYPHAGVVLRVHASATTLYRPEPPARGLRDL